MNKDKKKPIFKKGIWIREQQGSLTIGTLDDPEKEILIVPDSLTEKLQEFENDMIEALYGEKRQVFHPGTLDIDRLFQNLEKRFTDYPVRVFYSGGENKDYKGSYDGIYAILEKFIKSSLTGFSDKENELKIYINASLLDDHLCIIYRDSESISDPMKLKKEITFIEDKLNGTISYKKSPEKKAYYDMMIPLKK